MQTLASGVGDLKRVMSNVKARGTWGEVQLGAILAQFLAPGQYEKNVRPAPDSTETVEYAVRLPGPQDDPTSCVWLPIDSKFPQEDYLRLQDAAEAADADATLRAIDALSRTVRAAAKAINEKYLKPPATTDFGIMFLATEGAGSMPCSRRILAMVLLATVWPSELFPPHAVVPLPRDEPSVPSQKSFRCDDTGDFCQEFPAKRLTLYREPTSLVVCEAKLPPAEPSFEDSVLLE